MKNETVQNITSKHPLKRRYIIAAGTVLLLIITFFVSFTLYLKSIPDPTNEKIIREAAAKQLNKNPNDLNDADFAKVTHLDLSEKEVYNIKLLEKFKNLQNLSLSNIPYPAPDIPMWMVLLGKIRVIDLYKSYYKSYTDQYMIDLSPLENLPDLQIIKINKTLIKDIKPIAKLENLQEIHMTDHQLFDLGIFKGGAVPETIFIDNKEFELIGNIIPLPWIKQDEGTEGYLPKLYSYMQPTFGSPYRRNEIIIKFEVDKALH